MEQPPSSERTSDLTRASARATYTRLPDVDPADPELDASFAEHYVASFETFDELLHQLAEVTRITALVEEFADHHGLHGCLRLDLQPLKIAVTEAWDIVAGDGWFHVFEK